MEGREQWCWSPYGEDRRLTTDSQSGVRMTEAKSEASSRRQATARVTESGTFFVHRGSVRALASAQVAHRAAERKREREKPSGVPVDRQLLQIEFGGSKIANCCAYCARVQLPLSCAQSYSDLCVQLQKRAGEISTVLRNGT